MVHDVFDQLIIILVVSTRKQVIRCHGYVNPPKQSRLPYSDYQIGVSEIAGLIFLV